MTTDMLNCTDTVTTEIHNAITSCKMTEKTTMTNTKRQLQGNKLARETLKKIIKKNRGQVKDEKNTR